MSFRSPIPYLVAATLFLCGLLSLVRQHGYLQFLELTGYDLLVSLFHEKPKHSSQVALILVTEKDIHALGNWPLTDEQLARSLRTLLALEPEVIGLDIYRDLPVPPGTEALTTLLAKAQNIIAIEKFPADDTPGIPPPKVLEGTERIGFSDLVVDTGGTVRRALLFQSHGQRTGYAFALRLALAYLRRHGIYPAPSSRNPNHLRLGKHDIKPMRGTEGGYASGPPGGYQILLEYRHGPAPFATYTLTELLDSSIPLTAIKNKIVILGVAAESVKDYFATPFTVLDQRRGTLSGPLIHAHIAQQLIDSALGNRKPLRTWSDFLELGWTCLWVGLGILAGWWAKSTLHFSLMVGGGALASFGLALAGYMLGWWIPMIPNFIGWILAMALSSALLAAHRRRDQKLLMNLFSRQVSVPVARDIWRQRVEIIRRGHLHPRLITVTTLFADLQGFTKISEQLPPESFFRWLNTYMSSLTDIIMEHGGVLDDYAGDGIKANFGAPVNNPDNIAEEAINAVNCALEMCESLISLNCQHKAQHAPTVGMRIGIHTGKVVAGTLGSASRMKYTTVGSNVNLASRLESLRECAEPTPDNERKMCRILISANTAILVKGSFRLIDAGQFELKGFRERIRVYRVVCRSDEWETPKED